jgi:hypothetical protein
MAAANHLAESDQARSDWLSSTRYFIFIRASFSGETLMNPNR